jgi:hypothetical protein
MLNYNEIIPLNQQLKQQILGVTCCSNAKTISFTTSQSVVDSAASEIGVNLELLLQILDIFQNLKLVLAYKDIDLHSTAILAGCDSWWNLAVAESFYGYQKNTIKIGCANL